MKTLKSLVYLFLAAFVLVGCSDDIKYTKGPQETGVQVFFPENSATTYSISDDVSSIAIPINRVVTDETFTVPILSVDASDLFTIPSSVTFAAGQSTANLVITFNRTLLVDGEQYPIALLINDEDNTTIYGDRTLDIVVEPWPWEFFTDAAGVEIKTGKFREDWLYDVFTDCNLFEIDVTIYKHKSRENVFLIEEMFGWPYMTELFGATQAQLSGQFSYTPTNITLNCSNPDKVGIGLQWTGITENTYGYGNFQIATFVGSEGTLVNGVITFPKNGIAAVFAGSGQQFTTNRDGLFRIVLPGYEASDYSLTAKYDGMKVAANGVTMSAVVDFTYGEDVTGISYVFVGGDVTASADQIAQEIIDGTIDPDTVYEVANFTVGGGTVSTETVFEDAGTYTVIALPRDKTNELVASEVSADKFYFPGLGAAPNPLLLEYTKADITGMAKSAYFQTWDMWGVDNYSPSNDRIKLGQIVISENTVDDDDDFDAVDVKGISLGIVANDTVVWEYYGGVIYPTPGDAYPLGMFLYQGQPAYLKYITCDKDGMGSSSSAYMMIIGMVEEGYLAFVSNNNSLNFNGLILNGFKDAAYTDRIGTFEFNYNLMLVDPTAAVPTSASRASKSELQSLANSASVHPENFVELRGRERTRALIDEMNQQRTSFMSTGTRTLSVATGVCDPLPKEAAISKKIMKGVMNLEPRQLTK